MHTDIKPSIKPILMWLSMLIGILLFALISNAVPIDTNFFYSLDNTTLLTVTKPTWTGNLYIADNNNYLLEYNYWQTTDYENNPTYIEAYQIIKTIELDKNQLEWIDSTCQQQYMLFGFVHDYDCVYFVVLDANFVIDLWALGYTGTERYFTSLYLQTFDEYTQAYYNVHMHRYRLLQITNPLFDYVPEQEQTEW